MTGNESSGIAAKSAFIEIAKNGKLKDMADSVSAVVEMSFWGDLGYRRDEAAAAIAIKLEPPVNYKTGEEVKRRVRLCFKWIQIMRRDLHWSFERIFDTLPLALRKELDGIKWEPSKKDHWNAGQTI